MDFKKSKLELTYQFVLQSNIEFYLSDPTIEHIDIKTLDDYDKSIDYDLQYSKENYRLIIKVLIEINRSNKPLDGYKILVVTSNGFDLTHLKHLKQKEINNVIHYSALPIALNYTRNHIQEITKEFPLDGYRLPLIDLPALIQDKINAINQSAKDVEHIRPKKKSLK